MKIFFIASDIPFPGFTGGSTVNWSIINFLISKNHKLTIFSDFPRYGINEIDDFVRKKMIEKIKEIECDFLSLKDTKIKIKKKNKLQKLLSNKYQDYFAECYSSGHIEKIIEDKYHQINPDLIICYGSPAIHYVRNLNCKKAGWCDAVKSYFIDTRQTNNFTPIYLVKNLYNWIKISIFQRKLIKEFNNIDIRFIHAKDHAENFVKWGAKSCQHILPPYYDAKKLLIEKKEEKREYFKVIIVGLLSSVNLSQVEVLRKYVFPIIENRIDTSKIRFHFIGIKHDDLPNDLKDKDYVIARGYVEDLYNEITDCDLYFSVSKKGFGFRSRLCEALSLSACILCSKHDIYSLPFLKDNYNCYIVDDVKETGERILEIMKNRSKNELLKTKARQAFEDNFSYNTAGEKFNNLLLGLSNL